MVENNIKVLPLYFDYVLDKKYPVIILIGGRYSGKTHYMGQQLVMNTNNLNNYKVLVVEDVETNINEGVKTNVAERVEDFNFGPLYDITSSPPRIRHTINDNSLIFKGFHSDKQQKRAKSLNNIAAAWYEEAENITYEQFKSLRMLLRGGDEEDRQLFLSLNPINPEGFINQYFLVNNKPDKVLLRFKDGRPKVFIKNIEVEVKEKMVILECLVVLSTHWDNEELTDEQRADIEEYKYSNPDLYAMLGECKFIKPRGALIKKFNEFSLSKMNIKQAPTIKAVIDTASSGKDSATLGIYAKYDDEHHYLIDAIKDNRNAKVCIPIFAEMIKKYKPQFVDIEENHEGLYFESEMKRLLPKTIIVRKFRSIENKHEKILNQSGRMRMHFYVRDDGDNDYDSFMSEVGQYNKEQKKNKHDDCMDNIAMYFKHSDGKGKTWNSIYN